jgi:thiamine biosynthesis protein ThiS
MNINVTVNGQTQEVPLGTTLRELVQRLSHSPGKVAIELNRRLARPDKLDLALTAGDVVEIVTFVGGG